jgi:hypothetical protein
MDEIKYFYKKAKDSTKKGKFYYRPWKQLVQIILLNFKCLVLTGYSLDEIR